MYDPERFNIKSFFVVLYGGDGVELTTFQLPVPVVAPLANRLFREVLRLVEAAEPWYSFAPRADLQFQRSLLPVGPTSLSGERYDPDADPGIGIRLHPDALVRSFEVRLFDLDQELYRGTYSVDDVFLHGARYLLQECLAKGKLPADRGPFYYAIVPSKEAVHTVSSDLLPESAYQAEGVFRLPPRVRNEPRIQFRPVPQPPPPERDPAHYGPVEVRGKGAAQTGRVVIPGRLYAQLCRELVLSPDNEEGGYVLGNVFRQPGSPEKEDDPAFRWLVEVTDLLMAEDTVGSPVRLLFTGDTWSKVSRRRDRDFAGRKLVGWFHTHLFPASDSFGLSGLDQNMHAWYLPRPWQVALLLNLEGNGERTVRCYQRSTESGELVETPFEVAG
jgi:hypothetical protein